MVINLPFTQIGTLKTWPNKNASLENMPKNFKDDYPHHIIIIDCTELKFNVRLPLHVIQSQSYSNYKSANTLKSLVGDDSIMERRRGGSRGSNEPPLEVNNGGLKTQTVDF